MTRRKPLSSSISSFCLASLLALGCTVDEPEARPNTGGATAFGLPNCSNSNSGKAMLKLGLCRLETLFPEPEARKSELVEEIGSSNVYYPIVLAHGFNTGPGNDWGFHGIPEALGGELLPSCGVPTAVIANHPPRCFDEGGDGHKVYFALVPPFASVQTRAEILAAHVDQALAFWGTNKVHVIGHSLGGIDARDMIDRLGYGDRVATLTTVATAHHGTRFADLGLGLLDSINGTTAEIVINQVATWLGGTFNEASDSADVLAVLQDMSTQYAPAFNASHPGDSRVQYFTWAAVTKGMGGLDEGEANAACQYNTHWHDGFHDSTTLKAGLLPASFVVGDGLAAELNDGLATVASARMFPSNGDVRFQGCIPADHMDQVNSARPNKETGFDHVRFWRNIALDLVEYEVYEMLD